MRSEKERIVVKAVEKRIAIYSPHTGCDAVEGGVNDWLASGLGKLWLLYCSLPRPTVQSVPKDAFIVHCS